MAVTFAQATMRALASSAARSGAPNPTGAPVLRGSLEEGTFEHRFWRPYQPRETDKLVRAAKDVAKLFRRQCRQSRTGAGIQNKIALPALTQSAVLVFETLCELGRLCKGEIYPSYEWISQKTDLSRATIARSLKQLTQAGFLSIQRRCKRTDRQGPGPRFEQTSNAYRLDWPARLAKWLGFKNAPCPIPDDAQQRLDDRMLPPLTNINRSSPLDSILERMERMFDERESHNDPQPLQNINIMKKIKTRPSRPRHLS